MLKFYESNPMVVVSLDFELNSTSWNFLKLSNVVRLKALDFLFNLGSD